jgi:2-oxo-3-hexenedioate decarboxylase
MSILTPETLLDCADHGRALSSASHWPQDLSQGQQLAAQIVLRRVARGERTVGYKIGFTNRAIWPLYGVSQPIWGRIYDTTVTRLTQPVAKVAIANYCQPRLEPEIVFGMKHAPASGALADVAAAIDWYAHGVEIVHSVFVNWAFNAAQAFAAQGLHGALLVGPTRPFSELSDPIRQLAALQLILRLNDARAANGIGANVLDGPVQALSHLVTQLALRGEALRAGEIVTTGTLTDAMPLVPGQRWQTILSNTMLSGLSIQVGDSSQSADRA